MIDLSPSIATDWVVTATATKVSTGDMSEFSACFAVATTACRADYDSDGFVTGLDFDTYVADFEAGRMAADFDGDGFMTGVDFDGYVLAFEEGC